MNKYESIVDQFPSLQTEIRRLGFELACEDLVHRRNPDYIARRIEHKKLLTKYYKLAKMNGSS
jgi:hypothetical protein